VVAGGCWTAIAAQTGPHYRLGNSKAPCRECHLQIAVGVGRRRRRRLGLGRGRVLVLLLPYQYLLAQEQKNYHQNCLVRADATREGVVQIVVLEDLLYGQQQRPEGVKVREGQATRKGSCLNPGVGRREHGKVELNFNWVRRAAPSEARRIFNEAVVERVSKTN